MQRVVTKKEKILQKKRKNGAKKAKNGAKKAKNDAKRVIEKSDVDLEMDEENLFDEFEGLKNEIEIKKQLLNLNDLKPNNYVVTFIRHNKKTCQYVAQIINITNEDEIFIDYLKQNFDKPNIFTRSEDDNENECPIKLKEIVMILPEPASTHRGNYRFDGKISLNK